MATFLVNYDLLKTGQNYDGLIEKLKSYPHWCRFMASSWFVVSTSEDCVSIHADLAAEIDSNDKLIVMDVTGDTAVWDGLSDQVTTWIQTNLGG